MTEKSASTGKTVAIAASIPIALQDVLWTVLNEIYEFSWATPRFIASLVLLASFAAAAMMHTSQRGSEKREQENADSKGVTGGVVDP